MRSHVRGLLAASGALVLILLTVACHATTAAVAASPSASQSASPSARASAAAAVTEGRVVALGDSYTAGALQPVDEEARPLGCLRSPDAYPVLVADALGAPLTDVACTSAGVKDMTGAQKTYVGTNPAQLNALGSDDSIVLLSLGGDDLGFTNVLKECMALSFTDLGGSPCQAHYTAGGTDQLSARIESLRPQLAQVLSAIAARAPRARVAVVGYPDLFPQSGGCWPAVPFTNGDISYLRGIEVKVNAMIAADAQAAGDMFVNTYTPTTGHDFCTNESVRDVEGLLPGSQSLPFHPNARGQAAMANAVLAALRS